MTQLELVREYFPRVSNRDADYILWNMTAFPCNGLDGTREQLAELLTVVGNPRKRGWYRRLWSEAARIDREVTEMMFGASRIADTTEVES